MLTAEQRTFLQGLERDNDNMIVAALDALLDQGILAQEPSMVKGELTPFITNAAWSSASLASTSYQLSRGNGLGASASAFAANPIVRAGLEAAVDATIDWGIDRIANSGGGQGAVEDLKGGLTRHARSGGRTTLTEAVRTDPAKPLYRRVPQAGGCEWCLMLASRGYVYSSQRSALVASGERGNQPSGDQFHDWCNCSSEAQFRGEDPPEFVQQLETEWRRLNWVNGMPAYSADVAWDNWYQFVHQGGLGDRPPPNPVGRPAISTTNDPQ